MNSTSSSSESEILTPESVKIEANNVINNLLPTKSRGKYIKAYEHFAIWKNGKGAKSFSETVFLAYFQEFAKTRQPSTLWSIYSMLKATVSNSNDVQINTYARLMAFLKRQSEGHKAKQSKVLSAENVNSFLNEAPDYNFLAVKRAIGSGERRSRPKRKMPSLSINNPMEVLRQRLMLEVARKQMREASQRQAVANRLFLQNVGKRGFWANSGPASYDN